MKKSKYTEGHIAFALNQVEMHTPISEVSRKLGSPTRRSTGGRTNKAGLCTYTVLLPSYSCYCKSEKAGRLTIKRFTGSIGKKGLT